MKKLLLILAFLFTPSIAWAQCNGVFAPSTICGNSSGSPAPPKMDIPGNFAPVIPQVTRAQVSATHFPNTAVQIVLSGYHNALDPGFGAPYTKTNATSTGILAIQDADGNWWNLAPSSMINVGWFGCFPDDDGFTKITSGDISANPQWRGTYSANDTWDYVCTQEGIYAAFATTSTPGNIVWNVSVAQGSSNNRPLYIPSGSYGVNKRLYSVVEFGQIIGQSKNNAIWDWQGTSHNGQVWLCDHCAYATFQNMTLSNNFVQDHGLAQAVMSLDSAAVVPFALNTQQISFYDLVINSGQQGRGIDISLSGNNAQGDTIHFFNAGLFGNQGEFAVRISGSNALEISFFGGDMQGWVKNGVEQDGGGQVHFYNFHSENQQTDNADFSPLLTQFTTGGADYALNGEVNGSGVSEIHGWRAEDNILVSSGSLWGQNYGGVNVYGSGVLAVDTAFGWFQNYPHQQGTVITSGFKHRSFMKVDGGGGTSVFRWRAITSLINSTHTLTDSGSTYGTNSLSGFTAFVRYGSNGFQAHCDIASNTSTSITLITSCAPTLDTQSMYWVTGKSDPTTPPTWDSATAGHKSIGGFTTTAGSSCFTGPGGVGDYIVTFYGDQIAPSGSPIFGMPFYAKITATSGGACGGSGTLDRTATLSQSAVSGYYGTPITDPTGHEEWIQLAYNIIEGASIVEDVFMNGGGQINGPNIVNRIRPLRSDWRNEALGNLVGSTFNSVTNTAKFDEVCSMGSVSGTQDLTTFVAVCPVVTLQATSTTTLTVPVSPLTAAAQSFDIAVQGTGTQEKVVFASGFTANGPLDTGTSTSTFIVRFSAINSGWFEVSRTVLGPKFMQNWTFATLPSCDAAHDGQLTEITDAASPVVYNATAAGSGSIHLPVFCNGTNWTNH